ncbi:MAG: secretin N-terminal domain-containing protein [Verrucomicrobiota bacterium]
MLAWAQNDASGQSAETPADTPAAVEDSTEATPAADTAPETTTPAAGTSETYAPDRSGITVQEVETEAAPKVEATVTAGGEKEIQQVKEDIPALELDFPTGGQATLEFPTDVTTETDMEMGDDETISVDFPDEEVRTIIRNVADLYDLNVVIPETLVGSKSLKLRNVTWRQVYEVLLEDLGYTYVEDRNIIKIKSIDELLQEPVDTRVFLINYALAKNLQTSLSPLIDAAAGGRIQVDDRTNALIVTERPSRMNDIQEIIERLDQPTPQVMIHSMFIETQTNEELNLGINWPDALSFTLSGNGDNGAIQMAGVGTPVVPSIPGNLNFGNNAVLSMSSLSATINFLESNTDSRLVNHPTVVTMDGEEAKIVVGEEIPIPNFTFNEETGRFQVSGFEYRDTGSVLTVTPNVNSAGFIRLQVKPELSERGNNGVTIATGSGTSNATEIPSFDTKEAESTVVLKDGFTLVIGGLRKKETNVVEDKVPFLGDIPLIGELFTNRRKASDENETIDLLIFITARTLNPDGTTYKQMVDPRQLNRMGLTESELPEYRLPEQQQAELDEVMRLREDLDLKRESAKFNAQQDNIYDELSETDDGGMKYGKKNTNR